MSSRIQPDFSNSPSGKQPADSGRPPSAKARGGAPQAATPASSRKSDRTQVPVQKVKPAEPREDPFAIEVAGPGGLTKAQVEISVKRFGRNSWVRTAGQAKAPFPMQQDKATVTRDNTTAAISAQELVPGDHMKLQTGDTIYADCVITAGRVTVNQSNFPQYNKTHVERFTGDELFQGGKILDGQCETVVRGIGERTMYYDVSMGPKSDSCCILQ